MNSETALNYGVTGLPEALFIDRDGIVAAKWASPLNAEGLQLEITKIAR
jgi:hypothetical protein